ncbi:FAD dependent oxidoreductase [Pseudoneurospora amorphoporcata]|uniref:FAD dependent oxidoreductase n=1 Tax=Pseudoneurospora amorphoporcata TaxID=241081 RepID=A0AAN6SHK2_9PEZI|nr:FAD dependent oxidoreductase [Pseudoneurospora amorphoporcata]
MLEARQPCSGATGRNGGHCQPLVYSSSPSTAEFELATYHFIKSFVEEHGIADAVDWRALKTVHGYLTEEVWEGAKGLVAKLPEGLRAEVDLVDQTKPGEGGETLRDLRVPGVKGAVVQKHAGSLWPYKLVAWVLERLLEKYPVPPRREGTVEGLAGRLAAKGRGRGGGGFNLQSNTPVLGLRKLRGGKWGVITSRGELRANRVLLAMNGYTSNLLPAMKDLIVPVRSQVASLRPPKDAITKQVAQLDYSYAFVSEEKFPRDEYLIQRPLPGGELIYGGARSHAEKKAVGVWQDEDVERGVATYLRQNLAPYPLDLSLDKTGAVPMTTPTDGNETTELKATHQWTGIMGFSRDASPWVGQVPECLGGGENLFVCAAYTGHGMPQAALAARMVVEEIMGKPVKDDGLKLPQEMKLTEERVRLVRANTKTLQEQQQAPGWLATMPELLAATERRG